MSYKPRVKKPHTWQKLVDQEKHTVFVECEVNQWVILSVDLSATYLTENNCAEKTFQDWNAS